MTYEEIMSVHIFNIFCLILIMYKDVMYKLLSTA